MTSLILRTATRYLFPVILLFSIYALMRGHNEPGGGFVGGLCAASAYVLYALAYNVSDARRMLAVDPLTLVGLGLLLAASMGGLSYATGEPFLTAEWGKVAVSADWTIKLGTPLFFDIGVYLVVLGVTTTILFALSEDGEEEA